LTLRYAKEIWSLYEKGKLTPDVNLTGMFEESTRKVDVGSVLTVIGEAQKEHEARLLRKTKPMDTGLPPKPWQGGGQRNALPEKPRHNGDVRNNPKSHSSEKPQPNQEKWGRRAASVVPKIQR
jgi:hypothetical protein